MAELKELLLSATRRAKVIDDCVALVEEEVQAKSGLTGIAVKGAYTVVKAVKPGIIREAVDRLLDDFVGALEPFYATFSARSEPAQAFAGFLSKQDGAVANALLGVTDRRIERAKNRTIQKAYEKLRPSGEKHVRAAVPGVGRVVAKHLA